MKCVNHPEAEATALCINCSSPICPNCIVRVGDNTYCQPCSDTLLLEEMPRSIKLSIAVVLGIFSGAMAFIMGITIWGFYYDLFEDIFWFLHVHGYFVAVLIIPGLMSIIGSLYALEKEHFWVAVTGGIFASLSVPPMGIPALFLIATSKKEFKRSD